MMRGALGRRRRPTRFVAGAALVGVAGVVALAVVRATGSESFPTDPLGTVALAGGAVTTALAGERLRAGGSVRAARCARLLALSLLVYLLAGLWAVLAWPHGGPGAAVAVATWNTAWIPPLALVQLCASSAVRSGPHPPTPRAHTLVAGLVGGAALSTLLLSTSAEPFTGLATIAPEVWRVALAPVDAAAMLLGAIGLLVLPFSLWRAGLTSRGPVRARFGAAAAGATMAPLAVAFCLLLAVAREPGGVEPELGSVAFLVTVAGTSAVGGWCAVLAARSTVSPRHVLAAVRGTGLAAAALAVLAVGTLAVAPGSGLGAAAAAIAVSVTTLLVSGLAWYGTGRLAHALAGPVNVHAPTAPDGPPDEPPHGAPDLAPDQAFGDRQPEAVAPSPVTARGRAPMGPSRLPALTPREHEVLGLLAEGASNAGIAAELVVSDRTVDAHLRAIFHKLGLEPDSVVNRRVRAARMWLTHSELDRSR